MSKILRFVSWAILMASLFAGVGAFAQSAVPAALNFQGRLAKPDGTPVGDGAYSVTFSLYSAATGGSLLWQQANSGLAARNGAFAVKLDFTTGFTIGQTLDAVFASAPYLEIKSEPTRRLRRASRSPPTLTPSVLKRRNWRFPFLPAV